MSDLRIGVLGGGQLGRMLALAGAPLGMRFLFLDPSKNACAAPLGKHIVGAYDDPAALDALAGASSLVTFEFENVPASCASRLAQQRSVYPSVEALRVAQDRAHEKRAFAEAGVEAAPFVEVDDAATLPGAAEQVGLPAVLKTRTMGYDGKGQTVLRGEADLRTEAARSIAAKGAVLEAFIPFERELSLVSVRSREGEVRCYPLVQNTHERGILHRTLAPAPEVSEALRAEAERAANAIMRALDYVGVLTIEFFETRDDDGPRLVANEMAPRVHNSGHWTIEGARTSQFENHLRAIAGLPLGSTEPRARCVMLNCIGAMPETAAVLAVPGAHLHDYAKEPRAGRKVGHVTLVENDTDDFDARARDLESLVRASNRLEPD